MFYSLVGLLIPVPVLRLIVIVLIIKIDNIYEHLLYTRDYIKSTQNTFEFNAYKTLLSCLLFGLFEINSMVFCLFACSEIIYIQWKLWVPSVLKEFKSFGIWAYFRANWPMESFFLFWFLSPLLLNYSDFLFPIELITETYQFVIFKLISITL